MQIYLARTQGFCSGVFYAIHIVEKTLKKYSSPLYVYHEIVHNTHVVNDFKKRGVVFVDDLREIPPGNVVVLSAHGVPPEVFTVLRDKKLKIIDATCPLVSKVHNEAKRYSQSGFEVVLIGHKNHQETIGTAGYVKKELLHIVESEKDVDLLQINPDKKVAYITQTTLSVDDTKIIVDKLKNKFRNLVTQSLSDICYATQTRQDAVKELAKKCEIIIICGSKSSSNSNRLRETAQKAGKPSYLIDSVDEFDLELLRGKENIGISSGASVPRFVVDDLVMAIKNKFKEVKIIEFDNPEKNIMFKMPEL